MFVVCCIQEGPLIFCDSIILFFYLFEQYVSDYFDSRRWVKSTYTTTMLSTYMTRDGFVKGRGNAPVYSPSFSRG